MKHEALFPSKDKSKKKIVSSAAILLGSLWVKCFSVFKNNLLQSRLSDFLFRTGYSIRHSTRPHVLHTSGDLFFVHSIYHVLHSVASSRKTRIKTINFAILCL